MLSAELNHEGIVQAENTNKDVREEWQARENSWRFLLGFSTFSFAPPALPFPPLVRSQPSLEYRSLKTPRNAILRWVLRKHGRGIWHTGLAKRLPIMHLRVPEFSPGAEFSRSENRNRNSFAIHVAEGWCGGDTLSIEFRAAWNQDIMVRGIHAVEKKSSYNAKAKKLFNAAWVLSSRLHSSCLGGCGKSREKYKRKDSRGSAKQRGR